MSLKDYGEGEPKTNQKKSNVRRGVNVSIYIQSQGELELSLKSTIVSNFSDEMRKRYFLNNMPLNIINQGRIKKRDRSRFQMSKIAKIVKN